MTYPSGLLNKKTVLFIRNNTVMDMSFVWIEVRSWDIELRAQ